MEQRIVGKLLAFNAEVFRTEINKKAKSTEEELYPTMGDFAAYLDDLRSRLAVRGLRLKRAVGTNCG